jgi:hypothetical protein
MFDSSKLGILYDPTSAITGVSNGRWLDAWVYVDDVSGISAVNAVMNDGTDEITTSVSAAQLESAQWYHFQKNITSGDWSGWSTFDAANGIDYVGLYISNSTPVSTRNFKIDGVHFGLRPLAVTAFPAEREIVISRKKVDAMNNMTYSDLRDVLGEDYRFRIEIR